jgi:cytochrome c-type biogenesis protein CcmH
MIGFWLIVAVLATLAGLAVSWRAASADRSAQTPHEPPAVAVYRRQIAELDDLAAQGLIGEDEIAATRAEASRRLLSAAETAQDVEQAGSTLSRRWIVAVTALAGLLTIGVYLFIGRPSAPDQPYQARLAKWAATDPSRLGPDQMAAVLKPLIREHPDDPKGYYMLGQAQMAAGQTGEASRAFAQAARLAPKTPELHIAYGEALISLNAGKIPPEALAAFRQALTIDPNNGAARYYLARAKIADGDVQGGLADWRRLVDSLPKDDAHRAVVTAQIAEVERTGGLATQESVAAAESSAQTQGQFIQQMVSRLAARLAANPDDPEGWARLVRAYGVLKDETAQGEALTRARKLFANRPDALAAIEAQARAAPAK